MLPLELKEFMHNIKDHDYDICGQYKLDKNEAIKVLEQLERLNKIFVNADEIKSDDKIFKNDLIKRMSIGAPMNWTDTDRELGEESQFKSDMLHIQGCPKVQAIPIPNNATNGEVLKALFPNLEIESRLNEECVYIMGAYRTISHDWWNAPYNPQQNLSYTDKSGANIASQDVLKSAT